MVKANMIIILLITIIVIINAQCSGCGCCAGCSSCSCVACSSSSGSACSCADIQLRSITNKECAKCLYVFSVYDAMAKNSEYEMIRSIDQSINTTYVINNNVDLCLYLNMCSQSELETFNQVK